MKTRLLIISLACLLSANLTVSVTACPPPPCPDCQTWDPNTSSCIPYGDCDGGCPDCESCVDCYCECTSDCCEDEDCGDPNCFECVDCNCVTFDINSVSVDKEFACVGCDVTFTVTTDPSGEEGDVSWSAPGGDPNSGTGASFTTNWDTAGTKTATASLCGNSDSNQVTVVEVASLLPDVGTEMDDGDGDPNTKSFVVAVVDANADSNVVRVIATPNPNVDEPNLPDCWSFTGGTEVNDLEHTVDRTTPGKTVLTCTCNTSSKTTRIYVVKVDINAGLSEEQELDPGRYINVNWDDDDDDGWEPNETPPGAAYTGDKSDPNIVGGDNDLRSFTISISPAAISTDFPNSNVNFTFSGGVKVWETNTKLDANDVSSGVSSGTNFTVANLPVTLYLEGVSGSADFKDAELKATYVPCDANDVVKVTVFEVTLTGIFGFGGQQADNDKKHSTFHGSSDKNGRISWDDADANGTTGDNDPNCQYFHNCMECRGTVKPTGVTTEVTFNFGRESWRKYWKKVVGGGWQLGQDLTNPWRGDDLTESDEDKTPSATDYIYHIDGPGFGNKNRGPTWDYLAQIGDFREWVTVTIDGGACQCSNFYKWHTKLYTKPKDANDMTRDGLGQLGGGWITVPNNP